VPSGVAVMLCAQMFWAAQATATLSGSFPVSVDQPIVCDTRRMRIVELAAERDDLHAFVIIDHDHFPVCAGGTRMLADVDVPEVARLARAMTWKFAACRIPYGGAKAGVRFEGGDRAAVLAAYRRALEPYRGVFLTGPDMGTFPEDFLDGGEDPVPLWARTHDGLGMDDLATGHGVKAAAEAALAHLGCPLAGAAVAIEGFGKVGAGAARAFQRAGARVVGVSTVSGLLADPDGLAVEELIALRDRYGDRFVDHADTPARDREELFELDCDVLVPGARPDSITPDIARHVRCTVIAPAANAPYDAGATQVLQGRGIIGVPDFVANAGGVHLYASVADKDSPVTALAAIEEKIQEVVARTLAIADEHEITPVAAALADGRAFFAQATGAPDEALDELFADTRP
jgi:glutamate dehydrogenase (NAD(P)+)